MYMYYAEVANAKVSGKVPISSNMPTNQNCSYPGTYPNVSNLISYSCVICVYFALFLLKA